MIFGIMTEAVLFLLAMIFPGFGLYLPAIRVKNMLKNSIRVNIISHIVILIFITVLFREYVIIYLVLFFLSEIMFFTMKKHNKMLSYDKIIVTSVIVTLIFFVLILLSKPYLMGWSEEFKKIFNSALIMYDEMYKNKSWTALNEQINVDIFLEYISKYYLIMFFVYQLLINMIIYLFNDEEIRKNINVSYIYTLLFVVAFAIESFYFKGDKYLLNLMLMVKWIYAVQAVLLIDKEYLKESKLKYFFRSILWLLPFMFLNIMFIIGALNSFRKKKTIKEIEN